MDSPQPPDRRRYLVVTGNAVVAEDLRELLGGERQDDVQVFTSLQPSWSGGYAAAFFDVPLSQLTQNAAVQALSAAGTAVVVLNAFLPEAQFQGTGFQTLVQPFRTEDVINLLAKLGLTGTSNETE